MGSLDKEVFVCIDCESTGLDPKNDRILEVAIVRFTIHEILDRFETLINPGYPISKESMAIHNITEEMVQGKPKIEEMLPQILAFIGKHIIVGHSVKFDIDLITEAAGRAGLPATLSNNTVFDTLRIARHYGESPTNSLDQLRQHFHIEFEKAHRAMNDVIVNVEVFRRLVKNYKRTEEISALLAKPVLLKIMPLKKYQGRPMHEVPLQFLYWAAKKDFDQDLLYSVRTEISRRKKGNLFTQVGNAFSGL